MSVFTINEVIKNNGKDGKSAWIILDNNIYDVTNVNFTFDLGSGYDMKEIYDEDHNLYPLLTKILIGSIKEKVPIKEDIDIENQIKPESVNKISFKSISISLISMSMIVGFSYFIYKKLYKK